MEVTFVAVIIMFCLLAFILAMARLKMRKLEMERSGGSDMSLTTSELEDIIQKAVAEATAPMQKEIEALSSQVGELDAHLPDQLLDEPVERESRTIGRQRTR